MLFITPQTAKAQGDIQHTNNDPYTQNGTLGSLIIFVN